MILSTITRGMHAYELRVRPPPDDDGSREEDARILSQVLARPYDLETFRTATERIARDLMVIGYSDVEILRARLGQLSRMIKQLPPGWVEKQDTASLAYTVDKAIGDRGPIRGWQILDPAYNRVRTNEHGTLLDPAYYDITPVSSGMGGVLGAVPYQPGMITWDRWDFVRLFWQVSSVRENRTEGFGPVEDAYPLIDLLWTLLIKLADEVEQPVRDRLVSFQPSGVVPLTGDQIDDLVEGIRQDLHQGNIPVIGGVTTSVQEVGPTVHPEYLSILDQISLMLWVLFGTGSVHMGRIEASNRATAEAQVKIARRQALGNLLGILRDDLIEARFVKDPWSEFHGLLIDWEDTGRDITREDRMAAIWTPLMRQGFPVGAVLYEDYPEAIELLKRLGINPMALQPPGVIAAGVQVGVIPKPGGGVEEIGNVIATGALEGEKE